MKLFIVLTLLYSYKVEANVLDELNSFVKSFFPVKTEKQVEITLPEIPDAGNDAKSLNTYSRKSALPELSKKKTELYNFLYIKELFKVTRSEIPNQIQINMWMNVMDQGGSREGIYRALVLDNKYNSLERGNSVLNAKVIAFTEKFLSTYLSQSISAEALKSLNFYLLKRVIIEKTLEIMDELSRNEEDLFDWYAVLSSELSEYPGWKGVVRKNPSKQFHRDWASHVPFQHIKSETIIKLHKTFNHLITL
jgi:hypothetical protein